MDLCNLFRSSRAGRQMQHCWVWTSVLWCVPVNLSAPLKQAFHAESYDWLYAVTCLVHWASRSSAARCPTCKNSFSLVSMNKHLDGSVAQAPVQETVAMAARSTWFRAWLAKRDIVPGQGHGTSAGQHGPRSAHSLMQEEWAEDALYSYFEQEYEEDDVEEYYVGRSNGRRNAFGNRPFGPNGYVRSGRKLAAVPRRPKGKASRDVVENNAGSGSQSSQKAPQQGRRAQRKAKRASAD